MPRPASINDLPAHSRQGAALVTVHTSNLPPFPELYNAVADLVGLPGSRPQLMISTSYGSTTLSLVKTQDELDAALRTAQTSWDDTQANFFRWESEGVPEDTTQYAIQTVLSWATKEDQQTEFLQTALRDAKIREASK